MRWNVPLSYINTHNHKQNIVKHFCHFPTNCLTLMGLHFVRHCLFCPDSRLKYTLVVSKEVFHGKLYSTYLERNLKLTVLFSHLIQRQTLRSLFISQGNQPIGRKKGMAYHWRVAVHQADHLDIDPLLVHVLQQPHHLTHTQPFAVCLAHSNNVVTLFQTVSLVEEQELEEGHWNDLMLQRFE